MKRTSEPAHFLNIDLEIGSRSALGPLIDAMSARRTVHELYRGRAGGLARVHYEVHVRSGGGADATARALVRMIESLERPARACWDRARVRDFNVGIQAGPTPSSLEIPIEAKTVAAIAELGGRLVVTVYAP